jgi:NADPH:quinone reductase-like Zn-dependent oxidoreductase
VVAASVDRGTWHVMTGLPMAMRLGGFGVRRPSAANPGRCLAGLVEAVGPGVTGLAPGDEVHGTGRATFAEYAVAPAATLAPKPTVLSFEEAATVPISGVTALQAVRKAAVTAGERVLVLGASGGVGTFAVQLAKAAGAEVTAVCSAGKADLVRGLGADRAIDYRAGDGAWGTARFDAIVDIGGNRSLAALRGALTPRGRLVIVGGETGGRWLGGFDRGLRAMLLSPVVGPSLGMLLSSENAADLAALGEQITAGEVRPVVDRNYLLHETPAAIRYLHEGHARGKVAITI